MLVLVSQWGVLLFQATFALPVIFPRLRWIYVPAGLALHIGILLTLKAPFYQWIALYAIFIPWSDVFAMVDRRVRAWRAEHAPTTAATSPQAQRAP
jgi:hypothetical protein